jgi:hypothetical protein
MNKSNKPAVVYVTHDVLDRLECAIARCRIMHGKRDAGYGHNYQSNAGERSEIPEIIEVLWRRIFTQFMPQEREDWEAAIYQPKTPDSGAGCLSIANVPV